MAKMFQKFEFPAWSCQIFTIEINIPENQIGHQFRIHLGNPLCILLLIILGYEKGAITNGLNSVVSRVDSLWDHWLPY